MIKKMPYPGLSQSLKYLKIQILDSLPFANQFVPKFNDPKALFYWLKAHTTYINDPTGIELFQTMPRMFGINNFHGIKGAGDCDCFTIATIAAALSQNWNDLGIVLVGRSPLNAVHIYTYIIFDGQKYYLDLTNKDFDYQRFYPFYQEIKFKL
jgi:hypothetical protein